MSLVGTSIVVDSYALELPCISDCDFACSPTQELRGLGLANLVGCAFNCYTTTGSFSRSSVMDMVGSRTQLAGIISGVSFVEHVEHC